MNPIEYCRKFVYFWSSSPISGAFNESRYPLIADPLLSLDNIGIKCTVVFGPTQSLKTVYLQCATAYRLDIKRKSILACSQTDDDAKDFSIIKLRPFLERIPSLRNTVRKGTYSITNDQWLWATHELIISGPGENAQQSKSVCYLHTDEAHRWNLEYPGAMAALNDRMGSRWDRHELHCTTAPEAGAEVDLLYFQGQQNEWHHRCIHCNSSIWLVWVNDPRKPYNGEEVFRWVESENETEMLNSIHIICPYCGKRTDDTVRNRVAMDEGAKYVPANPDADRMYQSFRWNCFGPRWKPWRDLFAIYLGAIKSAKLGNLKPYENWVTKYEVRSNQHEYPMLGDSVQGRDYETSEVQVIDENKLRVGSADIQERAGWHAWMLCDEFERNGSSRRVNYVKLSSWGDIRRFQLDHHIKDRDMAIDYGHNLTIEGVNENYREVFAACARYHWYAFKSGDEENFAHQITDPKTHVTKSILLPYSEPRLENPMAGQHTKNIILRRGVPPGFCLSRLWSKPTMYPILYAHKNGSARYYGIAKDINPEFVDQLHSYIPALEIDKKTGTTRKMIWKKVKNDDHAFVCSAQSLMVAHIAGFFPLSDSLKD
jgi:hypothetical protein